MITNLFANMFILYYFDAQRLLTYILLFNRMNHKLKQVAAKVSRANKLLF
jgi:hypothetical protein